MSLEVFLLESIGALGGPAMIGTIGGMRLNITVFTKSWLGGDMDRGVLSEVFH